MWTTFLQTVSCRRYLPVPGVVSRRGWSLIEILVAIAIIGVLLALMLPALGRIRQTATRMKCLSHLRTCQQLLDMYLGDAKGHYPYQGDRKDGFEYVNGGFSLPYFSQLFQWPNAMRGLMDEPISEERFCPRSMTYLDVYRNGLREETLMQYPHSYMQPSDYWLSASFLASPLYWMKEADASDQKLWKSVPSHQVRYPGAKGVLVEYQVHHAQRDPNTFVGGGGAAYTLGQSSRMGLLFHTSFSDGHATGIPNRNLMPGELPGNQAGAVPVIHTRLGVEGRDIQPE